MKTRLLYLLFALLLVIPSTSYGQLGGIVRRAVNRQVNNEIDSALDKKVQDEQNKNRAKKTQQQQSQPVPENESVTESADADDNDNDSGNAGDNSGGNAGGAAFSGLFGNKVTLKYKDDYGFTSRIHMITEQYDGKDVMKMNFYMYYSANQPSIGIETQTITDEENQMAMNAKMIMDGENKTFLMLSDINGMKMGTISEIPEEDNSTITGPDGKPVKNYKPPTFTKTGNTRVIAGYKCDEYSYKNTEDKSSGKVWFTRDANLKIDRKGWNNSGMSYYYGSNQFNDGIILANEAYDDKGKLEMKSETVEINTNFPYNMSPAGYTLRQMNLKK